MKKLPLILTSVLISIALFLVAAFSQVEIFPCQAFKWDSSQGYYNVFCPIMDEEGKLLIGAGATDDIRPTVWTWPSVLLFFGLIPYGLSVLWARWRKP